MPLTCWDSEYYKTNIDEFDTQNEQIFKNLSELYDLCSRGYEIKFKKLLDFIESMITEYFKDQEKYMETLTYPDLDNQKAEHDALINEFANLKRLFNTNGCDQKMVFVLYNKVYMKLVKHVSSSDKKISEFINKEKTVTDT